MNRIIEIQRKTVTRDSFGGVIADWQTLSSVWAERLSTKPSERFLQGSKRLVNQSTASFRIRAYPTQHPGADGGGVVSSPDEPNELDRVVDDNGILWDILGIVKNDRRFLTLQVGHLGHRS